MFKRLRDDIDTILSHDPAARSRLEVVLCYPGLQAILMHRMASAAWRRNFKLLARFLSHLGRIMTGIEIHPGATIGNRVFIDHGMGVVIGETAEVGDDVTLYQGVTLGGTSLHGGKRHPTVEASVIVGSGAQVLGPLTVGKGARVGANAVVLKDVPAGVTMVGIPARQVLPRSIEGTPEFHAYGTPSLDIPDPTARVIDGLMSEMQALRVRLDQLEGRESQDNFEKNEKTQEKSQRQPNSLV